MSAHKNQSKCQNTAIYSNQIWIDFYVLTLRLLTMKFKSTCVLFFKFRQQDTWLTWREKETFELASSLFELSNKIAIGMPIYYVNDHQISYTKFDPNLARPSNCPSS